MPRAPSSAPLETLSASVGADGAGDNTYSRHSRQSVTVVAASIRPVHDRKGNLGQNPPGPGLNSAQESTERSGKRKAGGNGSGGRGGGGGGDVRLTQCPRCRRFADKYVEHDFVVLFIDLVLVKPQVRILAESIISSIGSTPEEPLFLVSFLGKKGKGFRRELGNVLFERGEAVRGKFCVEWRGFQNETRVRVIRALKADGPRRSIGISYSTVLAGTMTN